MNRPKYRIGDRARIEKYYSGGYNTSKPALGEIVEVQGYMTGEPNEEGYAKIVGYLVGSIDGQTQYTEVPMDGLSDIEVINLCVEDLNLLEIIGVINSRGWTFTNVHFAYGVCEDALHDHSTVINAQMIERE